MEHEENYEDEGSLQVMDISAIEAQTRGEIDMQIATAHKFPRNIVKSTNDAVAIATMNKDMAESCGYSLPRRQKQPNGEYITTYIMGPSVHLATVLCQCWGNLRADTKVVNVGEKTLTSQSTVIDLEKNVGIRIETMRSIMTKYGRMKEDLIVTVANAANSIAFRNAVFKVVPRSVIDTVYKATREMVLGELSDATKLIQKRKQVLDKFLNDYQITEAQILTHLNLQTVNQITAERVMDLIGLGVSIKDGAITLEQVFFPEKTVKTNAAAENLKKAQENEANPPASDPAPSGPEVKDELNTTAVDKKPIVYVATTDIDLEVLGYPKGSALKKGAEIKLGT